MVGGDGKDDIDGGSGRDLLIGGRGRNAIKGRDGDDLLVEIAMADPPEKPDNEPIRGLEGKESTFVDPPRDQLDTAAWTPPDPNSAGAVRGQFGRFQLAELLGKGSFGEVYRAYDPQLEREVALKIPRLGAFEDAAAEERFLSEARAAARLQHRNLVAIYDAGRFEGRCYIASALIRGRTLRCEIQDRAPLAPRRAAELVAHLALAMHHAHDKGIIHRDLKPENILLDADGEPCVMDFGLARRPEKDVLPTDDGALIGTPAYMSPEQAAGQSHQADARSDQWSLGVILYELLTRNRPFRGELNDLLSSIRHDDPLPPRKARTEIPRDLEAICLKCLAKDRNRRYASCRELAEELFRWLEHRPVLARPVGPWGRLVRCCRRRPAIAALCATVVVGLVAGSWGVALYKSKQVESNTRIDQSERNARASEQESRQSRYAGLLKSARDLITRRPRPWRADAIQQLDQATKLLDESVGSEQKSTLRSLLSTCLASTDMRQIARWDTNFTPYCLAFSRDGQLLAVAANHYVNDIPVAVWSFQHSRPVDQRYFGTDVASVAREFARKMMYGERLQQEGVRCLAFYRNDSMLLAGARRGDLVAWDRQQPDGDATWRVPAHNGSVLGMAISPDEKTLYTSGNDDQAEHFAVRRWNLGDHVPTLAGEFKHGTKLGELVLSAEGRLLACVVEGGPMLLLDTDPLRPNSHWQTFKKRPHGEYVSLSPDTRMLALGDGDGSVEIWELESGARASQLFRDGTSETAHDEGVKDVEFDPTGQLLATTGGGVVKLWEVASGRLLASDAIGTGHLYVRFSPTGDRLAVAGNFGVSIYAIERSEFASTVAVGVEPVEAIDLAAGAPALVSLRGQREKRQQNFTLDVWDLDGGPRHRQRVRGLSPRYASHDGGRTDRPSVAIAPDGRRMAYCYYQPNIDVIESDAEGRFRMNPCYVKGWRDGKATMALGSSDDQQRGKAVQADPQASDGLAIRISPESPAQRFEFPVQRFPLEREPQLLFLSIRVESTSSNGIAFEFGYEDPQIANHTRVQQVFLRDAVDAGYQWYFLDGYDLGNDGNIWIRPGELVQSLWVDRIVLTPFERTRPLQLEFASGGDRVLGIDEERLMQWRLPNWEAQPVWSNSLDDVMGSDDLKSVAAQGDLAVVGMDYGHVFAIANDQARNLISIHQTPITALDVSRDGAEVAAGTDSGEICLASVPRNEVIHREPKAHDGGSVSAIQFAGGGQLVVSTAGRTIKIWRRGEQALECLVIVEIESPIRSLRVGGDGAYLAFLVEGESGARVWDLRKLKELLAVRNVGW